MDPLSDICATIQVRNASCTRVEASAPWGVITPGLRGVNFVLLVRGSCVLKVASHPTPIALRSGDVFITLDQTCYEVSDEPQSRLQDCQDVLATKVGNTVTIGGGGAPSTFVNGVFELNPIDAKPLLSALPSFLYLRAGLERSHAFESVLGMLANEAGRLAMGSDALIARLFEILFIHAVRAHCEQQAAPLTGWLAVMADANLRHAAHAMHDNLGNDWTLEMLARTAGMSRTSFANRFKDRAGQTPLQYLTLWRAHAAAKLILGSALSLGQIARSVGYRSEPAFNRMFVREIGLSPGRYRKAARSPG
ncbi:AraC family transcriptional regulator [Variovorax sp. J31P207]|uniref:AraC family transcriptional regulator n=1 Tax=Variovorax sp. J31P207 TaxID=3053510 RepID=UPI00257869FE|nr:AraC family transcriptional regulator [Variovorax sp. J31P207]MDM0065314.1 AraC family transcriptional regulator [Variovorax sp. J31P207]